MTRFIEQPVHIEEGDDGRPTVIYWPTGRECVVGCLEHWVEVGEWWMGERPKSFYRVLTDRNRVYELYRELSPIEGRQPKTRYADREREHEGDARPTDTKHLADFHLTPASARAARHTTLPQEAPNCRWILYKALD
ncbi:MAG: hypothetical protein AMXMBFR61_11540 [Fimbriimonadales bacterium]